MIISDSFATTHSKAPLIAAALRFTAMVEERLREQHAYAIPVFRRCFLNTIETTTELQADGTTFVFTGDIPALWLRDSSAQVRPYVALAAEEPAFQQMLAGLIRLQAKYLLLDAYANAFNKAPNWHGHRRDQTSMNPWVWERKFALDSLCYPIQLCKDYLDATGDQAVFDARVYRMLWRIVDVMRIEQQHRQRSPYRFRRPFALSPRDTLSHGGWGPPVAETGMVWSGFRPSDDACRFGYHIPANMFAVVVLGHIIEFAEQIYHDQGLMAEARRLRDVIDQGIQAYGVVQHPRYGRIYAYETDGMGHYTLMDDANVPSLLSIPYLGYRTADDETYQRTRAFVLSRDNPFYAAGRYARGIGSPHTFRGSIWPLSLAIQGLTATDDNERERVLDMLVTSAAGTNLMHESFDPNRPRRFTRPWFAWANSMFALFVCKFVGMWA